MSNKWLLKESCNFRDSLSLFYKRVLEFNEVSGNNLYDDKLKGLYTKLVDEEIRELLEAFGKGDPVQYLKELADCFVVASYCFFCHNPDDTDVILNTENANISDDLYCDNSDFLYNMILSMEEKSYNNSLTIDALESYAYSLDVDFTSILHEVMDSNFSKFLTVQQASTIYEGKMGEVCKGIEKKSEGRYNNITSLENNGYIVFRDGSGKILKGPLYKDASISKYIPHKWL